MTWIIGNRYFPIVARIFPQAREDTVLSPWRRVFPQNVQILLNIFFQVVYLSIRNCFYMYYMFLCVVFVHRWNYPDQRHRCYYRCHSFQEHLIKCEFVEVPCPKGCNQNVERKVLEHHLKKECSKRTTTCQHCKTEVQHKNYKVHCGVILVVLFIFSKYQITCFHRKC